MKKAWRSPMTNRLEREVLPTLDDLVRDILALPGRTEDGLTIRLFDGKAFQPAFDVRST